MLTLVKIFFLSCCVTACITPLVRRIAVRMRLLDHPDGGRKKHHKSIPLGGGIAVLVGFVGTLIAMLLLSESVDRELLSDPLFTIGFVGSCIGICVLGVVDDRFAVRGRQKLAGQLVVASGLIGSGMLITKVHFLGVDVSLGIVAVPFTLFWLLAAINAVNLIDGVDGLATSVGVVLSLGVAAMAVSTGHKVDAMLAVALAGALAGFLFYNSPPASIFLGDAGSMLIGLILGVLSIRCCLKGPATAVMAAPIALLSIPFFDVTMAILRRKLTGRSIYAADRSHFHHFLLQRGYSYRSTVLIFGGLCCLMTVTAVISVYHRNEWLAIGSVLTVCALMVTSGLFGRSECLLLLRRAKLFAVSLLRSNRSPRVATEIRTQLRGHREWGQLWETLTVYAGSCGLSSVRLHLCVPELNEDFHASWQSEHPTGDLHVWTTELPLILRGGAVGSLVISGLPSGQEVSTSVSEVILGLKPFETELLELVSLDMPVDDGARPGAREGGLDVGSSRSNTASVQ